MDTIKKRNIILLIGVHSSGKTTLASKISRRRPYKSISASKIISKTKKDHSHKKIVTEIEDNQNHLINGINKLDTENNQYIIDGHLCLFDDKKKPCPISYQIFEAIRPDGIVFLYEKSSILKSRIKDKNLDILEQEIKDLQKCELDTASIYSMKIEKPLIMVNSIKDENLTLDFIDSIFDYNE